MILVLVHSWLRWMDDQGVLGSQESAGSGALLSIEPEHSWLATSPCVVTHTSLFHPGWMDGALLQ